MAADFRNSQKRFRRFLFLCFTEFLFEILNRSAIKTGLALLVAFFCCQSCGLADYGRDEDNKYVYIRIPDPSFQTYCLAHWDLNGDGRISRYEAQRVREMDCSSLGIFSMTGIEEFTALRRLDCSGNQIASLDLTRSVYLEELDCSDNQLISLDLKGLRSLNRLYCRNNLLTLLDLGTQAALSELRCGENRLVALDVRFCATDMAEVNTLTTGNTDLTVIYKMRGQTIKNFQYDSWTQVQEW